LVRGSDTVIGGASVAARNVISGNDCTAILVSPALTGQPEPPVQNVSILGNFIGTNSSGSQAVPNSSGIDALDAPGLHIGSSEPGGGNVVSGNSGSGIALSGDSAGARIINGLIGTDSTGGQS